MARLKTLYAWAIDEFGDSAPCKATLRNYAKHNMIYPPALKAGRHWMVEANARYIGTVKPLIRPTDSPLLKRILSDNSLPPGKKK